MSILSNFIKIVMVLTSIIIYCHTSISGEIAPLLRDQMNKSTVSEKIPIIIYLKDQVNLNQMEELLKISVPEGEKIPQELRYKTITHSLKYLAEKSQASLTRRLRQFINIQKIENLQSFWIRNILTAEATSYAIEEISKWQEVENIYYDGLLELDRPNYSFPAEAKTNTSEPGLRAINAHRLWEIGYTGTGRLVMVISTGVDTNNLALKSRWRGYGVANDCDGHGTHVMGTICGRYSGINDTLGVAPDAHWIAADPLCGGLPLTSRTIAALQWAANPDGDTATVHDIPDVVCCPWYDPNVQSVECTDGGGYWSVIDALEAIGTAVIFSAGGGGPGSTSITAPANRNSTAVNFFAVGAVDANYPSFPVASFSSRGPSKCTSAPDSLMYKPEVVAPGVNIRSATGTNGYRYMSGTSPAAAHVAGAIALLKQVAPNMTGTEIKYHLLKTATDLGNTGDDNSYGHGMINLWNAYEQLITNVENEELIPTKFYLEQNYPNPFNPNTIIKYGLPEDAFVKLEVYNILGQRVKILKDGEQKAGFHQVTFNSNGLASGLYFYRIEIRGINDTNNKFLQIRKMLLSK